MKLSIFILMKAIFLFGLGFHSLSEAKTSLQSIDLALNWKPEPEFGGFYEATRLGLDQKEGLKLNILPGGSGQPVAQMLASKKVRYGIVAADELVLARAAGMKIKAVFAVFQNNPQGFMVHPNRGIKNLEQLFKSPGVIALQKGMPFAVWLEKKYSPVRAKLVPYAGGVSSYLAALDKKESNEEAFSQQCFVFSEPILVQQKGKDSKVLMISESGYNPYLALVAVHEDTIQNHKAEVKSVVKVIQSGWKAYLRDSRAANQLMAKLNPSMDLQTFDQAAKNQFLYVQPQGFSENKLGQMEVSRFKQLIDQLHEIGLIREKLKAEDQFL